MICFITNLLLPIIQHKDKAKEQIDHHTIDYNHAAINTVVKKI